jgi:hypothetical protein
MARLIANEKRGYEEEEEEEDEEEDDEEEDREPEVEDDEDPEEEVEDGEVVAPTIVMASGGPADLLVSWPALQIICCASLFCFRMESTLNSVAFLMEVLVCILHFLV